MLKKRLVAWLVLIPFCIILVLFALANRQMVLVGLDPFMGEPPLIPPVEMPMFLAIYLLLIIGVLLGGTATWFAQGRQRRQKRQWRSRARELQMEKDMQKKPAGQDATKDPDQALL